MDENEYRSAWHSLNGLRCVFEKSILTQNCNCPLHQRFNLAEREGIRCSDAAAQARCKTFLDNTRSRARFALKLTDIIGNLLPHNKEIQVQKGALLALCPELPNLPDTPIGDIHALIEQAAGECGGRLEDYPYQKLMPGIVHHPPRPPRSRRRKNQNKD
jgi:hypothetical protein